MPLNHNDRERHCRRCGRASSIHRWFGSIRAWPGGNGKAGNATVVTPEGIVPLRLPPSREAIRPRTTGQHTVGMSLPGIKARRPCEFNSGKTDALAAAGGTLPVGVVDGPTPGKVQITALCFRITINRSQNREGNTGDDVFTVR